MAGNGPVPKRTAERRRRNKVAGMTSTPPPAAPVEAPPAPEGLHPIAAQLYESLRTSGQSLYYEPSDWVAAAYVCEAMSRSLKAQRFSGQLFASVMSALTELLVTEGARRRARLEVERLQASEERAPGAVALDEYRARLTKGGRRA